MLAHDTHTHTRAHSGLKARVFINIRPLIMTHIPVPSSSLLHSSVLLPHHHSPYLLPFISQQKRNMLGFTLRTYTNWKYINHKLSTLIFFKPSLSFWPSFASFWLSLYVYISFHSINVIYYWILHFLHKKIQSLTAEASDGLNASHKAPFLYFYYSYFTYSSLSLVLHSLPDC